MTENTQPDPRTTYEENSNFIRDNVERLESGQVTIDELETLTAEMNKAFQFCRERLGRTRKAIAETMQAPTQADN